jgi:hypothetical protein
MMIVVMVIVAVIPVIVVVAAAVPVVSFSVPAVIVLHMAAIPVPISCVELLAVVAGCDPVGALIGRPSPISFVPLVVVADWIPIAVHESIPRARTLGHNANDSRTWRRTDSDAQ